AHLELAVELLRFLAVPQFPFVDTDTGEWNERNLLEARVIVTTYNDHVRLLSPEPWLVSATKVYSGVGADIVIYAHGQPLLMSHILHPFWVNSASERAHSSEHSVDSKGVLESLLMLICRGTGRLTLALVSSAPKTARISSNFM